jgi:hypothetical protein
MDVEDFSKNLKHINLNGVTLNLDERMQLQLSFEQISADFSTESLFFWGKLIGRQ